jgi:HEAT repeats
LRHLSPPQDVRMNALRALGGAKTQKNREIIEILLLALIDPNIGVRMCAAESLGQISEPKLISKLQSFSKNLAEDYLDLAISAIQNRCKFYNYEIWKAAIQNHEQTNLAKLTTPTSSVDLLAKIDQTTQQIDQRTQEMAKEPKNNFSGATFNALVNFGDNPTGDFIGTQNNYTIEPEVQNAIADLQTLLTQLQTQHPQVTTEAQAFEIIDVKFKEIEAKQLPQWQSLMNVKRLWNGCIKAGVKVGEHFTDQNVWGKALLGFLEGIKSVD